MSESLAETALIDQHIYKGFQIHEGPQNVYQCDHCGEWHFTSKALSRNERLEEMHESGEMRRLQSAQRWERF